MGESLQTGLYSEQQFGKNGIPSIPPPNTSPMVRILVPVKRVIDYAVKIRVSAGKVETANVKVIWRVVLVLVPHTHTLTHTNTPTHPALHEPL